MTLDTLHGIGDAHRLRAENKLRPKTMKSLQFWRLLGHFWSIGAILCRLGASPMRTKLHVITLCPIHDIR